MKTDNIRELTIGRGMLFPIQLTQNDNGETGWYPVTGDTKLIENNISSILYYQIGQRIRQENFGTRIWECIEEPNTQALKFIVKQFIQDAFEAWEPRLSLKDFSITQSDSKLDIVVQYQIAGIGSSQYLNISYDYNTNSINS
jgi:phage baseplate assembly protein W|nr:MAG TPA: baseplate assembly protein [Caudoviricetes sp.]